MSTFNGRMVSCSACAGYGLVQTGTHDFDFSECKTCNGSGGVFMYPSGALARYSGGPLVGSLPRTSPRFFMNREDQP